MQLKHKQKPFKKPLIAGLVFALLSIPAGFLAVHAQPVTDQADVPQVGWASAESGAAAGKAGTNATTTAAQHGRKPDKATANNKATNKAGGKSSETKAPKPSPASAPAPAVAPPAPQPVPVPMPAGTHSNIITTIFWIGEAADASNAGIPNAESAWDGNWQSHYGGFDDPVHRNGYYPAAFTPKENPFYFALPYNDLDTSGKRKASAGSCPNAGGATLSWCKNSWIKITKGGKTAYAQWQDVGPLQEDDSAYVFGSAAPKNTWGAKAGLDVSPAVRDYLGLSDVDHTSWSFVGAGSVPAGPWKSVVTTSQGGW